MIEVHLSPIFMSFSESFKTSQLEKPQKLPSSTSYRTRTRVWVSHMNGSRRSTFWKYLRSEPFFCSVQLCSLAAKTLSASVRSKKTALESSQYAGHKPCLT